MTWNVLGKKSRDEARFMMHLNPCLSTSSLQQRITLQCPCTVDDTHVLYEILLLCPDV